MMTATDEEHPSGHTGPAFGAMRHYSPWSVCDSRLVQNEQDVELINRTILSILYNAY